ncbi:RusA family crossover junction endodeoxyribonuclease [Clostridium sp. CTA-7]
MSSYAKVIVPGSPISKSNFKLHNKDGRAILPYNTGKAHDRYALYEEEIAYYSRIQNPDIVLEESLIAVLKVYYKSEKRHPDTANITKSIFDGIEKSGLIVNDAQIRRIITEEFYDKENPRFELEFFGESEFEISYSILPRKKTSLKKIYSSIKKGASKTPKNINSKSSSIKSDDTTKILICEFCSKKINDSNIIKANSGKTLICRTCFNKLF